MHLLLLMIFEKGKKKKKKYIIRINLIKHKIRTKQENVSSRFEGKPNGDPNVSSEYALVHVPHSGGYGISLSHILIYTLRKRP
jgi:hypothetical protein